MRWSLGIGMLGACTSADPSSIDAGRDAVDQLVAEAALGPDIVASGDRLAMSWTERRDDADELHLATWSPTEGLATARVASDDVVVGLARKPSIAWGDDGTVWVSFTSGDPRGSSLWLARATNGLAEVEVERIATAGPDQLPTLLDQPEVRVGPDGDVWLMVKAEVDHPTVELWLGRGTDDFDLQPVTPFPGRPCECCPHQLDFTPDGEALLTIRNDQQNLREIWVARAGRGSTDFDRVQQVSTTGWIVPGCPFDGPRMAARRDPRLVVTWVDATEGVTRPWLARSDDGGASWREEEALLEGRGTAFAYPLVVDDGTSLWVAAEELWDGLVVSREDGDGWQSVPVDHVREQAELVVTDQGVFVFGLDDEGALWLEALSD